MGARGVLAAAVVATLLTAACGGDKTGGPTGPPDPPEVVPPEVTLGIRLHREDFEFKKQATAVEGEMVDLQWRIAYGTDNDPEECIASGDWSGSKSTREPGGVETTDGLAVGDYRFAITCSNSAGSDSDTVTAEVALPSETRWS